MDLSEVLYLVVFLELFCFVHKYFEVDVRVLVVRGDDEFNQFRYSLVVEVANVYNEYDGRKLRERCAECIYGDISWAIPYFQWY